MRARHKRIEIAHRATVHVVVGRDLPAAYALARRLEPQLAEVVGDDEKGACVAVTCDTHVVHKVLDTRRECA